MGFHKVRDVLVVRLIGCQLLKTDVVSFLVLLWEYLKVGHDYNYFIYSPLFIVLVPFVTTFAVITYFLLIEGHTLCLSPFRRFRKITQSDH